jgi:hypothetical protein
VYHPSRQFGLSIDFKWAVSFRIASDSTISVALLYINSRPGEHLIRPTQGQGARWALIRLRGLILGSQTDIQLLLVVTSSGGIRSGLMEQGSW